METKLFQQGDVILESILVIPKTAKKKKDKIVAEGEATGHHHRLTNGCSVYEDGEDLYVDVEVETVEIVHEEHLPIELPNGLYKVRRVKEYDHFAEETRQVRD